jgi:inner membrane transporter RhtA
VRLAGQPLGFVFAFANCTGFVRYVILGHRIANTPTDNTGNTAGGDTAAPTRAPMSGIDQLGASMLIALLPDLGVSCGGAVAGSACPMLSDTHQE